MKKVFKYNKPFTNGFILGLTMLASSLVMLTALNVFGVRQYATITISTISALYIFAMIAIEKVNRHNAAFRFTIDDQGFHITFNEQRCSLKWDEMTAIDYDSEGNMVIHQAAKGIHLPILKNILYFDELVLCIRQAAKKHENIMVSV